MKIIIAGAYAIGTHLAKLLSRNDQDTVLIDSDEERLAAISSDYDLMTIHSTASKVQTLKDAGIDKADLFIAVTPDENLNMNACMLASALGAKRTVAKVDNYEYIDPKLKKLFENVGISSLIYPENLAARDIANGLKMSWVRQRWDVHDGALVMLGIKLRDTCEILNEPLKDLCKPESPYHIVAIKRGEDTIIPRGDDVLMLNDLAYFMTTRNYIPYIRKIVGKEHYVDVKNVMMMGGGATAVRATTMMPEYMNTKLIEQDEARCEKLNELIDTDRTMVIHGDGRDLSLLNEVRGLVDSNLRLIHETITKNLYQQLGVEPRELFSVERYETTDVQGHPEKGYLYNYQRKIGPVTTKIRARLDERGKLLDAIQTK